MAMDIETQARILAAEVNAPRFKGRKALLGLAARGDSTALQALECSTRVRVVLALGGKLSAAACKALELPELAERERIRAERQALARQPGDPLAERKPGEAIQRAAMLRFERDLDTACFRVCEHSHRTRVRWVERGQERAYSESGWQWASDLGMCNAYCRKAFKVHTSEHVWYVSANILRAPEASRGVLYLSENVRVRQSRGATLTVDRRNAKGGWRPA